MMTNFKLLISFYHLKGIECDSGPVAKSGENLNRQFLEEEHLELARVMKDYSLSHLYKKFCDAGVTTCMLFELDENNLDNDIRLTNLEKSSYLRAKRIYQDNKNKQSGTNFNE